ncbi:MAG: thiamine phosphate synthase [Proteobacteria bacterium]|nr:thiamine phosphate synthase [Pseudomonadota bacterium]
MVASNADSAASPLPGRALPRLMLVWSPVAAPPLHADWGGPTRPFAVIGAAVDAGLRLLQLRGRELPGDERRRAAQTLRERFPALELLINDDPALARELGSGLHLPERAALPVDWPPAARWGRAVHGVEAAQEAACAGAHFVVLGTIFPTPSKPGHPGAGLKLVAAVHAAVATPIYAIGGIDAATAPTLRAAGAHGVAVQRAILDAPDPAAATAALLSALA